MKIKSTFLKFLVVATFFVFTATNYGQSWPDSLNTGPSGNLTPHSGTITASTDGQLIENLDIDGGVSIRANNVTVRNCKFKNLDIKTELDYTGTVVEDCKLTWAGRKEFTLRRCQMFTQSSDLIRIGGPNVTIEDCFFYITGPRIGEDHSDIIQEYPTNTGDNAVVRHNTMWIGMGQNAALFSVSNVLIDNNLIAGGGYSIFTNEAQTVINNHFSTKFYTKCGQFGPTTGTAGEAGGNVWHETGKPVNVSCLKVYQVPVSGVSLPISHFTLNEGDTKTLIADIVPANAEDNSVAWSSSNDKVATVNDNGLVTAVSGGYAEITATTTDGGFIASSSVLVLDNQSNDLMNLRVSGAKFKVKDISWPQNIGDAEVCLWNDDKVAAVSINIDDNKEADHPWWMSMAEKYPIFTFSWFVNAGNGNLNWPTWQAIIDAGHEVQAHDNILQGNEHMLSLTGDGEVHHCDINLADDKFYHDTYADYNKLLEENLTNCKISTMGYPCGEARADAIEDIYIACRGVYGVMNNANTLGYLSVNSRSATNDVHDLQVLLDPSETLYNNSYYRGLSSNHYHGVDNASKKQETETFLSAIYDNRDKLWAGGFTQIARYGQERDTHTLNVTDVNSSEIRFDLTDLMNDDYFDFPLTVKLRIDNSWKTLRAVQDGKFIDVEIVEHEGNKYALVKAVPDRGEVIVRSTPDTIVNATGVTLDPATLTLDAGLTSSLTSTVAPSDATFKDIVWSSSDNTIASVNKEGLVTAINQGDCIITATTVDGGFTASCTLKINPSANPVTGVALDQTTLTLDVDQTAALIATVAPSNATNPNIAWTSSNTGIATVNENGLVSAKSAGNAIITVKTNEGGYIADCQVEVKKPAFRTVSEIASGEDKEIRDNGSTAYVNNKTHRVGGAGSGYDACSVHPFQLPGLNEGEVILSASFSTGLSKIANSPQGHIDLYGLPYRTTNTVKSKEDYYQGVFGGDINGVGIQDDFVTLNSSVGEITTSETANDLLVAYLNAQYLKGAKGGDYVFLRLNPDADNVGNYYYWEMNSANNSENKPTLEIVIGNGEVSDIKVTGVSLLPESIDIEKGNSSLLIAAISPSNANNKTLTWSSNDENVATVDNTGVVTAAGEGEADITVTTEDGGFTAVCKVTVKPAGIELSNIALNKPVTVDSEYESGDYPAEQAVDGNNDDHLFRWVSDEGYPHWIEIDLEGTFDISEIKFWNGTGNGYNDAAVDYTIQSWNGTGWENIINKTGNSSGKVSHTIEQVSTSKIKLHVTKGKMDGIFRLFEIEVYGVESTNAPVAVTGVSIDPKNATITEGQTKQLTATVSPADADDKSVTWVSDNTAVATVDANGVVSALSGGQVTITATSNDGNFKATCIVNVEPDVNPVTGISVDPETLTLSIGQTQQLTSIVSPDDASDKTVSWSSDNASVATVDGNGVVSGLSSGQVTITATTNDGNFKATCKVNVEPDVNPVTGISVDPETLSLSIGQTHQLTLTVFPDDADDKSVKWASDNTAVATVDANGVVSALSGGQVSITATTNDGGFKSSCEITIESKVTPVSGVSIDPISANIIIGQTIQLTGTVSPENASDKTVSWSSDDVSVATVDEKGLVTAIAKGTASISVTSVDGGFTAMCTVTVNDEDSGIDVGTASSIIVWPNPVSGKSIYIDLSGIEWNAPASLQIMSITGKILVCKELRNEQASEVLGINIENFKSGLYLLNIVNDKINYSQKLIIR